jgi:methylated-DNA-[protein]-cysteine S-methyltransferase
LRTHPTPVLIDSPVGQLGFDTDGDAVTALHWGQAGTLAPSALADRVTHELAAYFAGELQNFSVPLAPRGSAFQQAFYAALCAIPYGETRTYGQLAADLNVSAQAIGQACGANPIAILIPCHRVLGADSLGGFSGAGGVEAKVALLRLEGAAGLLI